VLLDRFEEYLASTARSTNALLAYACDVRLLSNWFLAAIGKSLSSELITPIDIRERRSHLLAVKRYKPTSADRRLASFAPFCELAR
jgi:hypothetical protein